MTPASACPEEPLLRQFLEERLSAADHGSISLHLGTCRSCTARLAALAGTWSLEGLLDADAPADRDGLLRLAAAAPAAMNDDDPGEPLALPAIPGLDRFEPVARGGMGIILKARDTALDRPVAVKVLARSWHVSDADRNRAEREAMLLARLDHPNIVRILAAGNVDGLPYLVME